MNLRLALVAVLAAAVLASPPLPAATLSEKVFRILTEIYELREADKTAEALRRTEGLLNRKLSDHERAQILLLKSDLLLTLERYREAISPMEKALATGAVPEQRIDQIRYNLGQLYSQIGRYRDAVRVLESWIREAKSIPSNAYFVLAACHLELNALRQARRWADKGRDESDKLTYTQYQFIASIYVQQSDWTALQKLLEEAIRSFPDKVEFWRQLAQVHMERDREAQALAVMRVAYANGLLQRGEDLVRLAQLMRLRNAPWLAASVMEDGMRRKLIEPTSRNWLLLGNSWMAAREYDRAYPPLEKAAEMTKKPRDWLRLARLYAQNAGWSDCIKSADAGLRTGPPDPGPFQILRGVCAYEEGDFEKALDAFAKARKSKKSAAEARGWIQFIENL